MRPIEQEYLFSCPFCNEENSVVIESYLSADVREVVDCYVCCKPIVITLHVTEEDEFQIQVEQE